LDVTSFSDTLWPTLANRSSSSTSSSRANYYEDLGLEPGADSKRIKEAYYSLSKQYHPDINVDNPEALRKFHVKTAFKFGAFSLAN